MAAPPNVDTIKAKVQRLPLVDAAVFEIIELLNDPNSTYDQIVERLSPDITARFLNLANSAYYGLEVRSIGHAVKLLGYNAMRQNLITSFLIEHFTRHLDFDVFDFDAFQARSQLAALTAKALGDILDYRNSGDLYTAAILHNIGELVLAVYFQAEYRHILDRHSGPGDERCEAERHALGADRYQIGAMVLERFNIPKAISDAVRHIGVGSRSVAESGDFEMEFTLKAAVGIADRFVHPSAAELLNLGGRLKETVSQGREVYRNAVSERLQKGGYQETFQEILETVSGLVAGAIGELLPSAKQRGQRHQPG